MSLKTPSVRFGSQYGEYGCPSFEYAVHEAYGSVVEWAVWVCFIGFVDEFGGTGAPFFGGVAVFSH